MGGGYALTSLPARTSPRAIAINPGSMVYIGVQNAVQTYNISTAAPIGNTTTLALGTAPGAIDFGFGTLFAAFPSGGVLAYGKTTFAAGATPSDVVIGPDGTVCFC